MQHSVVTVGHIYNLDNILFYKQYRFFLFSTWELSTFLLFKHWNFTLVLHITEIILFIINWFMNLWKTTWNLKVEKKLELSYTNTNDTNPAWEQILKRNIFKSHSIKTPEPNFKWHILWICTPKMLARVVFLFLFIKFCASLTMFIPISPFMIHPLLKIICSCKFLVNICIWFIQYNNFKP